MLVDLSRIKQLVKQNGDTFVFVEEGEPEMVVMSFKEYEKITAWANGNAAPEKPSKSASAFPHGAVTDLEKAEMPILSRKPEETIHPRNYFDSDPAQEISEDDGVMVEEDELISSVEPKIRLASGSVPLRLEDIALEDLPI